MKHTLLLTGLSLAVSAITLTAQNAPDQTGRPGGGRGPRHAGPPENRPHLVLALDADRDGVLSAAELEGASAALLKLDANGDGQITRDEIRPAGRGPVDGVCPPEGPRRGNAQGQAQRPPLPPVLAAVDVNQDGVLSADEIAAAPAALMTLDANQDGVLTRDELRPADRGQGQGRGRGFGGPRGPGNGGGPRGPRHAAPQPEVGPEI